MRRFPRTIAVLAVTLLPLFGGCTLDEESDLPLLGGAPGGGQGAQNGGIEGGIQDSHAASPSATPSATPSPRPASPQPSPTSKPTAKPEVAITALEVSAMHVVLFPRPVAEEMGLGFETECRLTGFAVRGDRFLAPVQWLDRSVGQLSVEASGRIATTHLTRPGLYMVRCQSVDDPSVYKDVAVEVRATSELGVVIQ
ncbi:hypothetical protein J7643_14075 [bacterium]|nr:hypothetical protein [bacterium]